MKSKDEWTGGCACGAVRYCCDEASGFAFHCRCRQCQRATGTGHASAFVAAREATEVTGKLKFFEQTSDRGTVVARGFCLTCGSPVLNKNSAFPGNLYIHAAILDNTALFDPMTVVFADSGPTWDFMDPALIGPENR